MQLRVLVFCTADLRLGSGTEVRARLLAEGLHECGAEVLVLSRGAPCDFSSKGIQISKIEPGEGGIEQVTKAALGFSANLIYGITEGAADWVAAASKRVGCPCVFDIHGIGIVEILELGAAHGSRLRRLCNSARWLAAMRQARLVTVANPMLVPWARRFYHWTDSIIGVTDVSYFTPEGAAAHLGRDVTRLQVLYAGNFFRWQGVELLLDAIEVLGAAREPFEFTILGSVGKEFIDRDFLNRIRALKSVNFVESVDFGQVAAYYRGADVLVIPRPFMLSTHLAFPQKLADYMASGRTVVATNLAPHRWALQSPPCGILCDCTAVGIVEGLRRAKDAQLRLKLSANARAKAVEQFCHLKQSQRVARLFEGIVSRN